VDKRNDKTEKKKGNGNRGANIPNGFVAGRGPNIGAWKKKRTKMSTNKRGVSDGEEQGRGF